MIKKILHQGWVGPKPPPDEVKRYCEAMQRMNPDFDYRWFGNEILDQYGPDPYVKFMLTRGEKFAFVVDRIRVLLLKDHGGIWIDPDSEPVRPLNRLTFWDKPWDFVTAHRSPYREAVQVKRGVAVVDNTVMASAREGRMINRLYNLSNSLAPVRKGAEYGWEIMDQSGEDTLWLNPRIFYSTGPHPEAVILHDDKNLGSWCETPKLQFAKP